MSEIFKKGKPGSDWAMQLITKGLRSGKPTELKRYDNKIFASDSQCPRRSVLFNFTEDTIPKSESSEFYFKIGDALQAVVETAFSNLGIFIASETYIPDIEGMNLRGKIDVIINHDNQIKLLEVKSCGGLPSKPKEAHVHQASIYQLATGLPTSIVYVSRHVYDWKNQRLKIRAFDILEDEKTSLSLAKKLTYINYCIEAERLPAIPKHLNQDEHCFFCPFKPICFEREVPPLDKDVSLTKADKAKLTKHAMSILAKTDERKAKFLKKIDKNSNEE
jgi:hypothetical protein